MKTKLTVILVLLFSPAYLFSNPPAPKSPLQKLQANDLGPHDIAFEPRAESKEALSDQVKRRKAIIAARAARLLRSDGESPFDRSCSSGSSSSSLDSDEILS